MVLRFSIHRRAFSKLLSVKSNGIVPNLGSIRCAVEVSKPNWIPFSISQQGTFFQQQPKLGNQYLDDVPLRNYLKRNLPKEVLYEIEPDLIRFGDCVASDINVLGRECELNPPKLNQQNAWGVYVNKLWTCDAWKKLHDISAEEGLIAIGYEKKYSEWSRLYQMVKLYLYAPSSGLYSCPLAMTDGAAKTIQMVARNTNKRFQTAFNNLISRDPKQFWTSGQWMTEKKGGSDVAGGTETIALHQENDCYKLYGYKWFTSAADSDMSLTLAKISDENGENQEFQPLSLFYLETKAIDGNLNNIHIIRLKDKLGTRQLPTAELLLDGTTAYKMSENGQGIAAISYMLTMTRIHNAVGSVSSMRHILNLASDYANRRSVFGSKLNNYPLHVQTLARMETEIQGSLLLLLEVIRWLGKQECNKATDEEVLLFRLLTPILKLYTAKQAVAVVSEGLECFGGQGYMEDTGIASYLRDSQLITAARDLAYSLARIYIGSLLIENASNTQSEQDNIIAFRWCCTQDLAPVHTNHQLKLYEDNVLNNDRNMIMLES
ncbi:acyl-CoA dehydrogenase family member 11-like, partial [Centruroides sculpturatus]|uniref:acyl-CoA dehydrogenase family member 11-like n=1 Tax=Centruroides sculpturatus TaxID=218467 RepID=UPI000C6DDD72